MAVEIYMEKIAFLDRDGVININIGKHCYVSSWEDFIFIPGSIAGIKYLNDAGYKVIVLTNQSGIAQNICSIDQIENIHKKMSAVITEYGARIDGIYYCPHARDAGCTCRKPGIGMFLEAEKIYSVDKENSFMIGDSATDIEAATNYGISSFLFTANQALDDFVKNILLLYSIKIEGLEENI